MKNPLLTMQYREADRDLALFYYRLQGNNPEISVPFLAADPVMKKLEEEFHHLQEIVESLEAPDKVYALVKHHFQDFLSTLSFSLEGLRLHPETPLLSYYQMIVQLGRLDYRDAEIRCQELCRGFRQVIEQQSDYIDLLKQRHSFDEISGLAESFRLCASQAEEETCRMKEYFPEFTVQQESRAKKAGFDYAEFLRQVGRSLADDAAGELKVLNPAVSDAPPVDDLSRTVRMAPEEYRSLLCNRYGVNLDELLAWHKEEIGKTRAECFRIAEDLHLPDTDPHTMTGVNEILFRYEPPCSSAEEMHARCNEYLKRTRALAHEYVHLPEDESCTCLPIPHVYKDSYPWGGYEGGDFRCRPYRGKMFLNQYNYTNISDGWIKLNSLHEAYPGHHVQYVRAAMDPTPETVKIGSRLIPILEGTCLRTERAFEGLFEEDPVFPLFIAYRRHHASVRIYVDLMMFYYGAALEEVIRVYEGELGFDRVTARAQVQAHQNAPGYFTCYYYGMKKLTQWEAELNYDKKTYTELLFSAGYISMESMEMLVHMTTQEQQRYFTEFPSLLRE